MLTSFGKFVRKLRIDHAELLKDMAAKFSVTTSYLSAVENGKRNIPETWRDIIINDYDLNKKEIQQLDESIYSSQQTLKMNLYEMDTNDKELVLAFARKFNELQDDEKNNIKAILSKKGR